MHPTRPTPARLWTGRILTGVVVAFLLFDAAAKILSLEIASKGTAELGYPESSVVPIGVLLLVGIVLYLAPRTSLLGAIYLTAYLGGAVATHVRVGSPLASHTLFPTYVAAMLWGGLVLRHPALLRMMLTGPAASETDEPAGR